MSSPVQIGIKSWNKNDAGSLHTAAIRSDGLLFTWGHNQYGQLGDGTIVSKSSPVQIGSSSWTAVSAGYFYTAAIRSGGTLFTWGRNTAHGSVTGGQLGDGTIVSKSSPVTVTGTWSYLRLGNTTTIAVNSVGALFTWGYNAQGQLGDNTTITKSSPVQIGALTDWIDVAGNYYGAQAVRSNGTIWSWGSYPMTGFLAACSSPVQVSSGTTTGATGWKRVVGNSGGVFGLQLK